MKPSTPTETKAGSAAPKKRGKFFPLFAVLIILLAIGYFLYERNQYSGESDANRKSPSVVTAQEEQGIIEEEGNAPFTITKARLQFESVDNIDRVKVVIEENHSNRRSIGYKYEWFRNDKSFGANEDSITGFKKGDKIDVRITPIDGKEHGRPVFLSVNIARVPPKIVENKTISFDGNVLSHQVKAVDPDGGTLSYSLIDAPQGMTIGKETGGITWHVTAKEHGTHKVNVMIKSSSGAEAVYPLSIEIGRASE